MRIFLFLLSLFIFQSADAQIVNIPDPGFKSRLLATNPYEPYAKDQAGNNIGIDANFDGEIQVSEALAVYWLDLAAFYYIISSLDGIEAFENLTFLEVRGNDLTSIDVTSLINLDTLKCSGNEITSLRVSGLPNLKHLEFTWNEISTLDLTGTSLKTLMAGFNKFVSLDVSGQSELELLMCNHNPLLTSLTLPLSGNLLTLHSTNTALASMDLSAQTALRYITFCDSLQILDVSNSPDLDSIFGYAEITGNLQEVYMRNNSLESYFSIPRQPNLRFICCDDGEVQYIQDIINQYGYVNCTVSSLCPVTGTNTTIVTARTDISNNGCDATDIYSTGLRINVTDGTNTGSGFTNLNGSFSQPAGVGTFVFTPQAENLAYYAVMPPSQTVIFNNTNNNQENISFCLIPNGVFKDLEITLLPHSAPRPGFHTMYSLLYKNKGTVTMSGEILFNFDDDHTDFVNASNPDFEQIGGQLKWNFSDLEPFEQREIAITLIINTPGASMPVNGGDILNFNANINPQSGDQTSGDNNLKLNQVVVNSFDPNDKTCLEGSEIPTSKIGDYLHYMIRFENTGTAEAVNIVVLDTIDASVFDLSSIQPVAGSHDFNMKISEGNVVSFTFDNVNLPFTEPGKHGYVAFKIKTKSDLAEFDTLKNSAGIYFDFNPPIITNVSSTVIKNPVIEPTVPLTNITFYPNPVSTTLHFNTNLVIESILIYDMWGRRVLASKNPGTGLYVGNLSSGLYMTQVKTKDGIKVGKFIKR